MLGSQEESHLSTRLMLLQEKAEKHVNRRLKLSEKSSCHFIKCFNTVYKPVNDFFFLQFGYFLDFLQLTLIALF